MLLNSQVGISCTRQNQATPFNLGGQQVVAGAASISIQTTAGTYTSFFRPKIFRDPLADTAKVLASYPKGTILPFAGPAQAIPAGWHICDGTNGTVNLVNRLPYGASSDGQLGSFDGQATHAHNYTASRTGEADIGGAFQPPRAFQAVSGSNLATRTRFRVELLKRRPACLP
jgi:hypothetical protein